MHSRTALSALVLLLLVAGCGDDDSATTTVRETVTQTGATGTVPDEAPAVVSVFFLRDGQVWPERRAIVTSPAVAMGALRALFEGPETGDLTTAIPEGDARIDLLEIAGGTATLDLSAPITDRRARAQLVYTLTQFPTVERVVLDGGQPLDRADFEDETPSVLVESPLANEEVEPGFRVTGTANTFEATFNYELRDAEDRVLTEDFVTATSGSGTRGTFEFTVPYELDAPQQGRLVVFEISAEDGSRTRERSIPLSLR